MNDPIKNQHPNKTFEVSTSIILFGDLTYHASPEYKESIGETSKDSCRDSCNDIFKNICHNSFQNSHDVSSRRKTKEYDKEGVFFNHKER